MSKVIEDFMDIRYSTLCPNCKKDLFKFIWDKQNVLSFSDRFEAFDVDGFNFYITSARPAVISSIQELERMI